MSVLDSRPSCRGQRPSSAVSDNTRRLSASSMSDDDDTITPCPREEPYTSSQEQSQRTQPEPRGSPQPKGARAHTQRPKSWRHESWHFEPLDSEGDDDDPARLWWTMLSIQRVFGCYNSARMRAAIEMGEDGVPIPSKLCLDLLNDSIAQLPEEARRQLDDFLSGESGESGSRRRSTRSWKRRLLHGAA